MTRNVRISGDETAPKGAGWGCQIATSDKTFVDNNNNEVIR